MPWANCVCNSNVGSMESTCGWASEADDTEIESAPSHDPNEDDPLWRVALLHASTRETRCTSCSNLECCRLMVSLTFTADYYEFMAEEVPNEARSHRRRARRLLKARRKFGRSLAANECWPRGVINGRK